MTAKNAIAETHRTLVNLAREMKLPTVSLVTRLSFVDHFILLDLSSSGIRKLPLSLGQMKFVTHLDLSDNKIRKIDSSILKEMKRLKRIALYGNKIRGLPELIGVEVVI